MATRSKTVFSFISVGFDASVLQSGVFEIKSKIKLKTCELKHIEIAISARHL